MKIKQNTSFINIDVLKNKARNSESVSTQNFEKHMNCKKVWSNKYLGNKYKICLTPLFLVHNLGIFEWNTNRSYDFFFNNLTIQYRCKNNK